MGKGECKYRSLEALAKAFRDGDLREGECRLIIDNDCSFLYVGDERGVQRRRAGRPDLGRHVPAGHPSGRSVTMPGYSVFRTTEAAMPLKDAWCAGDEAFQASVIRATQAIDRLLASAPLEAGGSRGTGRRIVLRAPVGVEFEVDEERERVNILRAWAYGGRAASHA